MINSNETVYIDVKKDLLSPSKVHGLIIETEECITKQINSPYDLKHTIKVDDAEIEMISHKEVSWYTSHLGTLKSLSNITNLLNKYNIEYDVISVTKLEYLTHVCITVDRNELEQKVELYNQYVHDKIQLSSSDIKYDKNNWVVFAKQEDDSVVKINTGDETLLDLLKLFNTIGVSKYNVTVTNEEFPF